MLCISEISNIDLFYIISAQKPERILPLKEKKTTHVGVVLLIFEKNPFLKPTHLEEKKRKNMKEIIDLCAKFNQEKSIFLPIIATNKNLRQINVRSYLEEY